MPSWMLIRVLNTPLDLLLSAFCLYLLQNFAKPGTLIQYQHLHLIWQQIHSNAETHYQRHLNKFSILLQKWQLFGVCLVTFYLHTNTQTHTHTHIYIYSNDGIRNNYDIQLKVLCLHNHQVYILLLVLKP